MAKKRSKKPSNSKTYKLNQKLKTQEDTIKNLKQQLAYQVTQVEQQKRNYEYENRAKIDMQKEKDRYYTESNQKTAKIARLEKSVTSLKEGMQKTLLAFDVLN